ncbi:MAG: hypothetical protein R8G66_33670 [Cytophagales bacterium]|nr:hypothetical protein [Cytophagales bacterium]
MRLTISLVILLLTGTAGAQSLENWSEIIFQSQARSGDYQEIRITPDSVHYQSGNRRSGSSEESHACLKRKEKKHLGQILTSLGQLDFNRLESPTNNRAFDGARHSQIIIKTAENQLDHYFDDESPNEKLSPLLTLMLKVAKE